IASVLWRSLAALAAVAMPTLAVRKFLRWPIGLPTVALSPVLLGESAKLADVDDDGVGIRVRAAELRLHGRDDLGQVCSNEFTALVIRQAGPVEPDECRD